MSLDKDHGYLITMKNQPNQYICDDRRPGRLWLYNWTSNIVQARPFNLTKAYDMCIRFAHLSNAPDMYYLTELTPKEQFTLRLGQMPALLRMHTLNSVKTYLEAGPDAV